jgi:hypothetical protein
LDLDPKVLDLDPKVLDLDPKVLDPDPKDSDQNPNWSDYYYKPRLRIRDFLDESTGYPSRLHCSGVIFTDYRPNRLFVFHKSYVRTAPPRICSML